MWSLETLHLDLKYTWKISRGATNTKVNYIVKVTDGHFTGLGEVAGITHTEALKNLIPNEFKNLPLKTLHSPEDIYKLLISAPLRFGLESALIHLLCQKQQISVWDYFNIAKPPTEIKTSFSIPIMDLNDIPEFIKKYQITRFPSCKIKVGKEHPAQTCQTIAKYFNGPLRIDANESFSTAQEVLKFLDLLKDLNIEFIEQPLPVTCTQEYQKLKSNTSILIFADESVQDLNLNDDLQVQFHGVNVKLMKTGSYKQALNQLQKAKELGLKTMLGCMVETSLGIYSALQLCSQADYIDLDGFLFFKHDPFNLVKEKNGVLSF